MNLYKFFTGKHALSFVDAKKQLVTKYSLNSETTFVQMQQVHEASIVEITNKETLNQEFAKSTKFNFEQVLPGIDASYTSLSNIFLSVKSADCLPILISGVDQDAHPFIAAAHAGRKGTQKEILLKLLIELYTQYKFSNISVWFGPAICVDCYQIDKKTNTHFDLIAENKKQIQAFLQENNLSQNAITLKIEHHCTLHEPEKFHSYRKTGPGVKMNYSFIGIQQ